MIVDGFPVIEGEENIKKLYELFSINEDKVIELNDLEKNLKETIDNK